MNWNVELFSRVLPRHMELITMIDYFFLEKMRQNEKIKNDVAKMQRLQIITFDDQQRQVIKISHLCFLASKQIMTLSMQQYDSAKSVIYRELDDLLPQKLQYVPQGINPRQWIQCTNPNLAELISDILGDDDEWLLNFESLRQIRPWKSDENFISRFQRVKTENKIVLIQQILASVTQTQYTSAVQNGQEPYITQKRIIVDDVDQFFTKYIEATRQGLPQKKEDDLMIQYISIEEDLFKTKEDKIYKLLVFACLVIHQLMQSPTRQTSPDQAPAPDSQSSFCNEEYRVRKILYVIKISSNLDPNLKYFLESLKTALLLRTTTLRLAIMEGDKIIAGQDIKGQKVEGALGTKIQQFVDLAHFLVPFQFDEHLKFLMNGSLITCNLQSLSIEILEKIKEKNMFTFGSTRQKLLGYQNFLKFKRDEGQLENQQHVSPGLLKVFHFMQKYQEQLPGFKYIVNDIFINQIFGAQNVKLTAKMTIDFEEYVNCIQRAQDQFFSDRIARS